MTNPQSAVPLSCTESSSVFELIILGFMARNVSDLVHSHHSHHYFQPVYSEKALKTPQQTEK